MNFVKSEILQDIQTIHNSYSLAEKKPIMEKYGITTKKKDEIEKILYGMVNKLRKNSGCGEFDDDDLRAFNRVNSGYGTFKKALEVFENESIEFLEFVINKYRKSYERQGNSFGGQSALRQMEVLEKVKYQKDNADEINSYKKLENEIFEVLYKLTSNFRTSQLGYLLAEESERFDNFQKYDVKALKEAKRLDVLKMYNFISLKSDKFADKPKYLKYIEEDYLKIFDSNLKVVAERLIRNGLKSAENIKINYITEDPKFLEMIVTANDLKFNCRSILAAEFSNIVRTHWRFLVTKMK